MNDNPIIVALDIDSVDEARRLVKTIGPRAGFYKVGLELYTVAGMAFVRELLAEGKQVFVDLKMYDIPETVKRAAAQVAQSDARFLTVHAVGQAMRAAREGAAGSSLELLAVTVLTSFQQADVEEQGYSCPISELVECRARAAMAAGMAGVIASPLEAAAVRRIVGPKALIVTPGVRSPGAAKGDQRRVATPAEAVRSGANYVVMGRQITRAADPAAEVARVLEEIQQNAPQAQPSPGP
jgi:orotidine-5'-phosphate decarboxylase